MAEPREKAANEEAPGEVRHSGQAAVRLILFAVVVLALIGLAWALVRMATRPAASPGVTLSAPALTASLPETQEGWRR